MQSLSNHGVRMICTLWHDRGSVLLSVKIDQGGYCPREYISMNTKVENQSTRRINTIHASLVQMIKYSAIGPDWLSWGFSSRHKTRQVKIRLTIISLYAPKHRF